MPLSEGYKRKQPPFADNPCWFARIGIYKEAVVSFIGRVREELEYLARYFSVEAFRGGTADAAINAALDRSGRGYQRKSPLQPRLVMWLVLMLPPTLFTVTSDRDRL